MSQYFVNGRVFTGDVVVNDYAVEVDEGEVALLHFKEDVPKDADVVDLDGGLLVPGFIDVQVNGGGGVLFNDAPSIETIETMVTAHRKYGTTSLLPTLISDKWEVMEQAAEVIEQGISQKIPGLLGVHFEGPYLSHERRGIHVDENIRNVDAGALDLLTSGNLGEVVTTIAPENVDAGYIRELANSGVHVCAGHTAATYDQARAGLKAGVKGFTHLFNAMSPLTSREPGVVGAALDDSDSWMGVIADGHHIHFASLRIAIRAKAKGKTMLVTDAMPSVGSDEREFVLQGQTITAKDGRCTSPEGTLAGSDLNMAEAVRNCVEHVGLPLEEALRMASLYPAQFLGLGYSMGRIEPGYVADFALLDESMNVRKTWIGGKE